MNFNPFYNQRLLVLAGILTEEISAGSAIVYHRTNKERDPNANIGELIADHGYRIGSGMY
jgi:hypothetical protein